MNINSLFPFVSSARIIEREKVEGFDLYRGNYLMTKQLSIPKEKLDNVLQKSGISDGAYVTIARIMPNDIYIYLGSDEQVDVVLNATNRPETVNAIVVSLDYGRVAQGLDFEYIGDRTLVSRLATTGGYETEVLTNARYVQDAKLGLVSVINQ